MKEMPKHSLLNGKAAMIKALHNLSNKEIAEMTGYSTQSVVSWMCNPESKNYRRISDKAFRILNNRYHLVHEW